MKKDRTLWIGCIGITELKIKVSDQFETYLIQDTFNTETLKIHGRLKLSFEEKQSEEQVIIYFLEYLKGTVIVAYHAAFDVAMINQVL